jgi:16S rRNA (uracil1498-N3)-methyltransferase
MKETRYFYVPDASLQTQLPEEEAQHALRVLRMTAGDQVVLIDGEGTFHDAVITETTKRQCQYRIEASRHWQKPWTAHLHLAMAPTKNIDRTEWLAEKATEIGIDQISLLRCQFSERTVVKTERLDKILISAMKQSRKALKPRLDEMTDFRRFIETVASLNQYKPLTGRFICHCYEEADLGPKPELRHVLRTGEDTVVLVGPEGDFSTEEVRLAMKTGFQPVSLGQARLRTETAALVAVHLMNLQNTL